MARSSPAPQRASYKDLVALPEHVVGEILDGELIVSPRPASPHAHSAVMIDRDIGSAFGTGRPGTPGGWWILIEPELHFGSDVVVPDLAGWRRERLPAFPNVAYFTLAPDWVCEVASPSTVRVDRLRKMSLYAAQGVPHVWLVDPLAQTLECYRLEGGRWVVAAMVGGEAPARVEPFEAVEIDLASWWPPIERP